MANQIARVFKLLIEPKVEWDAIAAESIVPRGFLAGYVAPLAALPCIAMWLGLCVLGVDVGGQTLRAPGLWMLATAGAFFVLALAGVVAFAFILDVLIPAFGGGRNFQQALKVSAYSVTAALVAGILTLVPALGVLALIGAGYSLYVLFLGAPKLMRPAPENALNYAIVATLAALVLGLLVGLAAMTTFGPSSRVLFPQQAARAEGGATARPQEPLVALASRANAGSSPSPATIVSRPSTLQPRLIAATALKSAAPNRLAGFDRVALGVEAAGSPSAPAVRLEAEYRKGRHALQLEIIQSTAIASVIGFNASTASEYDRETAEGYVRRRRESGDIVVEEWNRASQTGSYARMSGDQVYVRAAGGEGVVPADLKRAVDAVLAQNLAQLERAL